MQAKNNIVLQTTDIVETDPAQKNEREAVIGMPASDGQAAQILNEYGIFYFFELAIRKAISKQGGLGSHHIQIQQLF